MVEMAAADSGHAAESSSESYLRRIEFGPDGYARLIRLPGYRVAEVVVDPERGFGQPVFARGGARLEDALALFRAGEPLDVAYFDYAHSRLKRFRVAVLGLAADRQLGAEAKNWLADARIDGVPVREVAERSDAGLEQALVVLAKTEPRRPRPRR